MKLSLKLKALLITFGMLALSIAGAGAVVFVLQNVPAETIANAFGFGFIAWMVYLLYAITLNRLEYNEKLKEFAKKD